MDEEKILLKTHLYHCMTLVDFVLGYNVTQGTGTSQDDIMLDVDKARAEVERLQSIVEAGDRLIKCVSSYLRSGFGGESATMDIEHSLLKYRKAAEVTAKDK